MRLVGEMTEGAAYRIGGEVHTVTKLTPRPDGVVVITTDTPCGDPTPMFDLDGQAIAVQPVRRFIRPSWARVGEVA